MVKPIPIPRLRCTTQTKIDSSDLPARTWSMFGVMITRSQVNLAGCG
jgi:hypothetical protein